MLPARLLWFQVVCFWFLLTDGLEDSVQPASFIRQHRLFLSLPLLTVSLFPQRLIRFLIAVVVVKWLLTLFSQQGREREVQALRGERGGVVF